MNAYYITALLINWIGLILGLVTLVELAIKGCKKKIRCVPALAGIYFLWNLLLLHENSSIPGWSMTLCVAMAIFSGYTFNKVILKKEYE